jgi:hypothetical protein
MIDFVKKFVAFEKKKNAGTVTDKEIHSISDKKT